jgi:hypothetical protein
LVLNIPANVFEEIISQEGLIELQQDQPSCSCGAILEKEWKFCPFCSEKVDSAIFEDETDVVGVPEKIFNYLLGLYLSFKKGYKFEANYVMDKDFNNETDIYLQKEGVIKMIEYTTKLDLNRKYVISKVKTLHLIEGSLKAEASKTKSTAPSCSLILLGINAPDNKAALDAIPFKLFEDANKFKIIDSKFKFQKTNSIQIAQEELSRLSDVFNATLNELISMI